MVEGVAGGVFWWMENVRCRKREKTRNQQNYETATMKQSIVNEKRKRRKCLFS